MYKYGNILVVDEDVNHNVTIVANMTPPVSNPRVVPTINGKLRKIDDF